MVYRWTDTGIRPLTLCEKILSKTIPCSLNHFPSNYNEMNSADLAHKIKRVAAIIYIIVHSDKHFGYHPIFY
jgi:hypothetical protein